MNWWRWMFVIIGFLASCGARWAVAGPTGSLDDFGPEYYLFSRAARAVNLRLASPGALPEPPPVANVVPSALAPRIAMLLDTREEGVFRVGDTFRIRVRTSSRAYLQVVDVGTNGDVSELYPRKDQPLAVEKNDIIKLDGTQDEEWKVQPPLGTEWILAFATSSPVKVPADLLSPSGTDEPSRVARLQKLKEQIKELCRSKEVDVGFCERSVEIRDAQDKTDSPSGDPGASPAPAAPAPPVPPAGGRATYPPGETFALCVGINQYQHGGVPGFPQLRCAVADATAFRDALVTTMKVPVQQVRLLTDSAATREGIEHELAWLKRQAGPGKYAYLFWSGHGTQAVRPQSGEGITHSGLVPHDFDMKAYETNKPSRLLFDRELGAWIEGLSCAGLVILVDACYCGAITKATPNRAGMFPRGFFLRAPRNAKSVQWRRGRATALNTTRANTLVIEAAQMDQQAWEDRVAGHGLMTKRVLDLFDRGLPAPLLFQDVQGWVKAQAARDNQIQVPVMVDTVRDPRFVPLGPRGSGRLGGPR